MQYLLLFVSVFLFGGCGTKEEKVEQPIQRSHAKRTDIRRQRSQKHSSKHK